MDVTAARRIIDYLVRERQSLRLTGADRSALDANRQALAYWHRELGRAASADALRSR